MIGSVRAQLTVAVGVLVGVIALVGALVAPKVVRESLIDDRLEAQRAIEISTLDDGWPGTPRNFDPAAYDSAQLTAVFGPGVAALTSELDAVDALDELRSVDPESRLYVLTGPDVVATVTREGRVSVQVSYPSPRAQPVVSTVRLQRLAADYGVGRTFEESIPLVLDGSISFQEFLDQVSADFGVDLDQYFDSDMLAAVPRLGGENGLFGDDLIAILRGEFEAPAAEPKVAPETIVIGTREVDGRPMLLTASLDGIEASVHRVRTLLWLGLPVAMLTAAVLTWLLAGRALRPVGLITERTRKIRSSTLHERVPVPPTGDEISALATEMNEMLDRVQREDERRRQFISDASHELRSPIASIRAQAEAALLDPAQAELADGVLAEAERMGTLVDDLLALARSDESVAAPQRVVDLDDIVYSEVSRPRRVPIDVHHVAPGQVTGRPDGFARMLTHLLDNAARHAATRVEVSLVDLGDTVRLTVDDDGAGIAPEDRERIFDRFVRLDDARARDRGGAGLGLAVVDAVVKAAGGTVTVDEAPIGGARFVVDLPGATG